MATKLFLRNTRDAEPNVDLGVVGTSLVYDMITTAGSASDDDVVDAVAGGTQIIWTQTSGGGSVSWISGRVPTGGFTLTTTDISIWAIESVMSVNAGGRYRVFRYVAGSPPNLIELGGGPFNDGVEFGTLFGEMTWLGNVTDTAFVEDDRIVVKIYITNIGTMGAGTCTIRFNAADATQGDSFFNIAETVTFKAEPAPAGWGHLLSDARDRLIYVPR